MMLISYHIYSIQFIQFQFQLHTFLMIEQIGFNRPKAVEQVCIGGNDDGMVTHKGFQFVERKTPGYHFRSGKQQNGRTPTIVRREWNDLQNTNWKIIEAIELLFRYSKRLKASGAKKAVYIRNPTGTSKCTKILQRLLVCVRQVCTTIMSDKPLWQLQVN